ncbi:MAG: dihydroorotate dehydrogenase electron transfer subunit [Elusimicrobia bacterium]|nr:dihydroorotate dehydrogenase electron transfer subunit [Elusimicrobiota bacterium]
MEAKSFQIKKNIHLTEKLHLLELEGSFLQSPVPGQFIHIKIDPFFLRRPFSIAGYNDNTLKILYRVVGRATEVLSEKEAGDSLNVIGPLGNGFPVNNNYKSIFLVGGGTGIAPLLFLTDTLIRKNLNISFFYGARTSECIAFHLLPYGVDYIFSTNDGSYGYKGLIGEVMQQHIKKNGKPDIIYGGGPYQMLKQLAKISAKHKTPAFVSLENRMACGTGICYGCVTKIKDKTGWEYKRVCKDGPVFNTEEVIWENNP